MSANHWPHYRLPIHGATERRADIFQPATTIALVILLAVGVIAVSIGIAQADTLGAMVDDETGRLALFGLIVFVITAGSIIGTIMWATAPRPALKIQRERLATLRRTSATSF